MERRALTAAAVYGVCPSVMVQLFAYSTPRPCELSINAWCTPSAHQHPLIDFLFYLLGGLLFPWGLNHTVHPLLIYRLGFCSG